MNVLTTSLHTLTLCATWLTLAIGFCSCGVISLKQFVPLRACWQNAYLAFWTGFALLMAALLVWNFFLPVNLFPLGLFTLIATASVVIERRWFGALLSTNISAYFVSTIGAVTCWVANHAIAKGGMDDYNYEFQAIRWFHDYRLVPGLGNLHGRIGFNNSHHLLAAMLSFGPGSGAVNHVFNGLFVIVALILLFAGLRDVALAKMRPSSLFAALLLCPSLGLVLFGVYGSMISTLKADVFVSATIAVLAVLFLEFAMLSPSDEQYLPLGATVILVAAVVASVKISALVFCSSVALAVVICLIARLGWRNSVTIFAVVIATLIVCSALLRGIILTGYPFYPLTMFGMNVDWRMPVAQAAVERAFITSAAQLRSTYDPAVVHGWTWIPNWAKVTALTDRFGIVLPLVLVFSMLAVPLARLRSKQKLLIPTWAFLVLVGASLLSLVVWFVQAPSGRFSLIYFWIVFAIIFTSTARQLTQMPWLLLAMSGGVTLAVAIDLVYYTSTSFPQWRSELILVIVFAVIWVNLATWAVARVRIAALLSLCLGLAFFEIGDRALVHALRHRWGEIRAMFWLSDKAIPDPAASSRLVVRRTRQGQLIYVVPHPQYETPLPNTPYFNPSLEFRVPGDLRFGFRNSHATNSGQVGYHLDVTVGQNGEVTELISFE